MGSRPSVQKTIDIVKRLIPDDVEGSEGTEEREEEDEETAELYDMFHMSIGGEGAFKGSVIGSISGPNVGGSTTGASTLSVHSTLGGPQKVSLSVAKEPSRRRRTPLRERKTDKARQILGYSEEPKPGSEERLRKRDKIASWFQTADSRIYLKK